MKTKLPEGWKEKIFIDCIEKEASSNKLKIPKQNFLEEGKYAIIDQGNKYIAGYTNDEDKIYSGILPIIIFGDHTRKFKFIDFKFALGADGTKILIPKKGINPKYFYYFLKNLKIPNHGYSRHYKFLKEAKIVYPPLKTQEAIVSLLEKAEKAKELRNEADELSKDYLKSVFVDMFGNPVKNPKKFKVEELIKLCDLKSGGTPSRKEKEFFCGDIPWITTVALGKKHISSNDARDFITNDAVEKSATKIIPKGSIMVGIRVGVGKTSINLCDMCTSQDIISLVNIDQRLNKEFFLQIFKYYESYFENKKRGATIQGITSNILKELMIPLPPIELQNKFAEIVKQVETMKEHQKESKEQIDDLFNALMQKAFKGELKC
jgi:type I restriction enzyme, S subunit